MKRFIVTVTRDDGREGARISRETELSGLINAASVFTMAHFACDPWDRHSIAKHSMMRDAMQRAKVGEWFFLNDDFGKRWEVSIKRSR